MGKLLRCILFAGMFSVVAAPVAHAGEALEAAIRVVPVTEEPLHVVRYRGEHFMVYTNWIEPSVWTLYHEHRNDLLAVIAADAAAASQSLNKGSREQTAPAGTVVFFPYADSPAPYVHRVGVHGDGPFINIGLEFQDPLSAACASDFPAWEEPRAQALAPNRRGQAYRLTLPAAAEVVMPGAGRGLLLVPLGSGTLQLDEEQWNATTGDFRFYDRDRPQRLRNTSNTTVTLAVFDAC